MLKNIHTLMYNLLASNYPSVGSPQFIRNSSFWNFEISIKNIFPILFVSLFSSLSLYSQSDNFALGSRAAALGNAYSTQSDIWSVQHNQAGLGFYPHFAIGFHHENKFIVPENNLHALALTLPVNAGTFGLSYSYFGFALYNESKLGIGFGKQFGNGFAGGIQLNFHHNYLEGEYGDRNALSVEGGIQYKASEKVIIGAHLFNPTRARIAYNQEPIPTVLRTGVSVTPIETLKILFQLEKRLDMALRIQSGMEYQLIESLYLRGGIMTKPFTSTFGLGYDMGKI
ncbi:MAG: hypothetical protein IH594_04790, partial [Bacteroidales bacterium]|nr:hypothetical protein [Bacteroidales bacterium]